MTDQPPEKTDAAHEPAPPPNGDVTETPPSKWPVWLVIGFLAVAGAFAAGLWQAPPEERTARPIDGEPQVTVIESTPTAIPTLVVLLPTPTPTREPDDQSIAVTQPLAAQAAAVAIPLPTVTPTPVPPPIAPRSVQVGGQANLRMQMAGQGFQSGGRPVQIPITPRTYLLDGETTQVEDHWCLQMGIVNLDLRLRMTLNRGNSSIAADGAVELYNDFCENRGTLADEATIALNVPADTRVQSTYNLFSERELLNLAGLLDMDTAVIVELSIANLRPQPQQE